MVLCDDSYSILSLLRPYTDGDGQRVAVKHTYPIAALSATQRMDESRLIQCFKGMVAQCVQVRSQIGSKEGESGGGKGKAARQLKLCRMLATHAGYAPALVEHALLGAGWLPHVAADDECVGIERKMVLLTAGRSASCAEELGDWRSIDALLDAFAEVDALMTGQALRPHLACRRALADKGFILLASGDGEATARQGMVDVSPLLLLQQGNLSVLEFASLDVALDLYFSTLDKQKGQRALHKQHSDRGKGVDKVAQDVDARARGLRDKAVGLERHAHLLLLHCQEVDVCLQMLRDLVARGRDWRVVEELLGQAQAEGVAGSSLVVRLKLAQHLAVLALPQDVDEEQAGRKVEVELDMRLNAMANAKALFAQKKELAAKLARTEEAKALSLERAQRRMLRLEVFLPPRPCRPPLLLFACSFLLDTHPLPRGSICTNANALNLLC